LFSIDLKFKNLSLLRKSKITDNSIRTVHSTLGWSKESISNFNRK